MIVWHLMESEMSPLSRHLADDDDDDDFFFWIILDDVYADFYRHLSHIGGFRVGGVAG